MWSQLKGLNKRHMMPQTKDIPRWQTKSLTSVSLEIIIDIDNFHNISWLQLWNKLHKNRRIMFAWFCQMLLVFWVWEITICEPSTTVTIRYCITELNLNHKPWIVTTVSSVCGTWWHMMWRTYVSHILYRLYWKLCSTCEHRLQGGAAGKQNLFCNNRKTIQSLLFTVFDQWHDWSSWSIYLCFTAIFPIACV